MIVKRYTEMKDSGVEWIGSIPVHWQLSKMKEVLRNASIKGHPEARVLSLYRNYGVIPKDSRDDNHNVTSEDTASYKYVEIGDLVINKMKAWQGSLGLSQYAGIVSPAYYVCKVNSNGIVPKYLHHLIRSETYAQEFERLSTGMRIGQWDLGIDDFLRVPLLLPPLSEQEAIAAYLDEKCGAIDEIIAEAKATIEEYKAWKESAIFEAVTKGLDPNAEMKDSRIDIIGEMPKKWKLIRQRFLCRTITGDHDTQDANPDGEFPFYVRSPNVECSNTYTFEGEGVLMAGDGVGAGKVFHYATGKYAIHQRVYCFYDFQKIIPLFYFYFMSNLFATEIEKGSAKSTVPSVRLPMLKDFSICVPSVSEQQAIVAYLDKQCAAIDAIITEKQALIEDLETYKKSLIYETVTGKRRVC